MKIALYGGSFDPPTKAHQNICRYLIKNKKVDQVWLLPCFVSHSGKQLSPYHDRVALCQLMTQNLQLEDKKEKDKSNLYQVSTFEGEHKCIGETVETLQQIHLHYSQSDIKYEFYFVIGMDNAMSISTWSDWEKMIGIFPFIIFNRGGADFERKENPPTSEPKLDVPPKPWFEEAPHQLIEDHDFEVLDMSSTSIRNHFRSIRWLEFNELDEAVRNDKILELLKLINNLTCVTISIYIINHKLYH